MCSRKLTRSSAKNTAFLAPCSRSLGINKEILLVNEKQPTRTGPLIAQRMLLQNHSLALISDCGTPVFADPGASLIAHLTEMGIQIVPIPGASSLMAALSILDVKLDRFLDVGFLPREKKNAAKRCVMCGQSLGPHHYHGCPLPPVAGAGDDVAAAFGDGAPVTLCIDLTMPSKSNPRGPLKEISRRIGQRKGEFVLLVH